MDRGRGGAAAPHHRLRDDYDGIARWLVGEPLSEFSATGKFVSSPQDATARYVRVRVGFSELRRLHPRSLALHSWARYLPQAVSGEPNHLGSTSYSLVPGLATAQKACLENIQWR